MWKFNGDDTKLPSGKVKDGIYHSEPGTRGYEAVKRIEEVLGYEFTPAQKVELAQHIEHAHTLTSLLAKKRYLIRVLPKDAAFVFMRDTFAED